MGLDELGIVIRLRLSSSNQHVKISSKILEHLPIDPPGSKNNTSKPHGSDMLPHAADKGGKRGRP